MLDLSQFSQKVRSNPLARSEAGLTRLLRGMRRIQSVLDTERVAAIRTLEMKISDGGPTPFRVEPHILGVAGIELLERKRVIAHRHPKTNTHNWYALSTLPEAVVASKLEQLVPVYLETTNPSFTAGLGDPLEISIFKILQKIRAQDRRVHYLGAFDLSERGQSGRYPKREPTVDLGDAKLEGPPDFVLYHPAAGEAALIECKNVREWIYPSSELMKTVIRKALAADMTPVLIARRLPYITKVALCAPAGIVAHETYNQLYPETEKGASLAARVTEKRGLGYSDVLVTEQPLPRTIKFFEELLPKLLPVATAKFQANKVPLSRWVNGDISWTQLRLLLSGGYQEPDVEMEF